MDENPLQAWKAALQARIHYNKRWGATLQARIQRNRRWSAGLHQLWAVARAHRRTDAFYTYQLLLDHPAFAPSPAERITTLLALLETILEDLQAMLAEGGVLRTLAQKRVALTAELTRLTSELQALQGQATPETDQPEECRSGDLASCQEPGERLVHTGPGDAAPDPAWDAYRVRGTAYTGTANEVLVDAKSANTRLQRTGIPCQEAYRHT
jgi:hypothetical protein